MTLAITFIPKLSQNLGTGLQVVSPCVFGLSGQSALSLSGPGVDPIGDNPGH